MCKEQWRRNVLLDTVALPVSIITLNLEILTVTAGWPLATAFGFAMATRFAGVGDSMSSTRLCSGIVSLERPFQAWNGDLGGPRGIIVGHGDRSRGGGNSKTRRVRGQGRRGRVGGGGGSAWSGTRARGVGRSSGGS